MVQNLSILTFLSLLEIYRSSLESAMENKSSVVLLISIAINLNLQQVNFSSGLLYSLKRLLSLFHNNCSRNPIVLPTACCKIPAT